MLKQTDAEIIIDRKNTTLGADKAELENLLRLIGGEFYLVVDGLDHISREYDLHKDLISRSETEIISELLEIHFPDNCYVTIASQPIFLLIGYRRNRFLNLTSRFIIFRNYCIRSRRMLKILP